MSDLSLEDIQALQAENARLTTERDTERAAREEADRRADGLYTSTVSKDRELATAHVNSFSAQENQADGAITAITTEMASLKTQQANLWAEGKFEEAAEIGEKMADAAARRSRAQEAKTYFGRQREEVARQPVDPVDRFLAQNNYSDAEQAWIKKNPRFATDREFQSRVTRAHAELVDKGVAPQSAKYFEGLEEAGYRRAPPAPKPEPAPRAAAAEEADPDNPYSDANVLVEEQVQTPAARPATRSGVAAAPSHRVPTAPQRQGTRRELTPDQAAVALSLMDLMPPEVQAEGEAGAYKMYEELNSGPTAKRLRSEWAAGG